MYIPEEIEEVLYSAEQIKAKTAEMGKLLTEQYCGKNPLFVGVLNGAIVFFSDLIRCVECPLEIRLIPASSYVGLVSSGKVDFEIPDSAAYTGRDIVIVEDIADTALTLSKLKSSILALKPASLKVVTLLNKTARRKVDFKADMIGFEIEDKFVVGYGLDYDGKYRNLPYIGVVKTSQEQKNT